MISLLTAEIWRGPGDVSDSPRMSVDAPSDGGAPPSPGWSDLAAFCLTFFALGVTVNVIVLESTGSTSITIAAAMIVNSATSELAYLAVRDAGGSSVAAVIAGWVVSSRFGLLAVGLGARLRVGRWHRAAAASLSFDPNVTVAVQQREPGQVVRVFWRVTAAMLSGWFAGTLVGALLGNVIGDSERFGLDALFPAALLAIIGNLLRNRSGALAAAIGGGLCLVLIPITPAGVPIIASLLGAVIAMFVPEHPAEDMTTDEVAS